MPKSWPRLTRSAMALFHVLGWWLGPLLMACAAACGLSVTVEVKQSSSNPKPCARPSFKTEREQGSPLSCHHMQRLLDVSSLAWASA